MKRLIAKISLFFLAVAVGIQVAMPAKAFYSTSSVVTDGTSVVSQGRGFLTDVVIPYVLPFTLALGVIAFVYYRIKRLGGMK